MMAYPIRLYEALAERLAGLTEVSHRSVDGMLRQEVLQYVAREEVRLGYFSKADQNTADQTSGPEHARNFCPKGTRTVDAGSVAFRPVRSQTYEASACRVFSTFAGTDQRSFPGKIQFAIRCSRGGG